MGESMDLNQAAEALEGLFDNEPVGQPDEGTRVPKTPEKEPDEDLPPGEELEEEGEEDEEGEESEEGDEPEGQKYLTVVGSDGKAHRMHIDKLLEGTAHSVKVAGEVVNVPYKELLDGYSRQADYTRKTMALADQEAGLAPMARLVGYAKTDPRFREYVEAYFQTGGIPPHLVESAALHVTEEQLAAALEGDNEDHRKKAAAILKARAEVRKYHAGLDEQREKVEKEETRLREVAMERELRMLMQFVPDYKEKSTVLKSALRDYGFSDEEISTMKDHRIIRLVNDAVAAARKQEADKRKASAPRVSRPTRGKVAPKSVAAKQQAARIARAQEVDTLDAWADALAGLEF